MHKSSMMKMEYFKKSYLNSNEELKILDIGSFDKTGNYNYKMVLNGNKWTYHGMDLKEGNNVDMVIENPYDWKEIGKDTYDVVVTGQALEHMEFFWLTMEEINRVLKPGGLCCIIVPSKGPIHKNPYDCYRFNEDGVRSLAKFVKFEILESGTTTDKISDPWYDSFVIAQKPGNISKANLKNMTNNIESKTDLENRMDDIENKMDLILEKLR